MHVLGGIPYRPEIDGLRAVSVASVIMFHADWSWAAGGFVGVDVFFVISGYLITSLIRAERQAGFSFAAFYERRIRRLLPPLIPVLVVCFIGTFLLLPASQLADFTNSLYATLALVSNWYFLSTVGYFDVPAGTKPLLHMWSLSIEEQFYLVWPAVIIGVLWISTRRMLLAITGLFTVASLVFAAWLIYWADIDAAFFNSFARFWQISIGAFLAMLPARHFSHRVTFLSAAIGLFLILYSVGADPTETLFPGVNALLATSGAVLIIAAGQAGGPVASLLSTRPFTYVGKLSYALYLWHWPLLVFTALLWPRPGVLAIAGALVLTFILSALSYHLIETPFRRKQVMPLMRQAYGLAVATTGVFAVALLVGTTPYAMQMRSTLLYGDRGPILAAIEAERVHYTLNYNLNYTGDLGPFSLEDHKGWTCSFYRGNTVERVLTCLTEHAAPTGNILVVGDSVGRDTWHSLRSVYPNRNFLMLHDSGCPPAESAITKGNRTKTCFPGLNGLLETLVKNVDIDAVVLAYRYKPPGWRRIISQLPTYQRLFGNVALLGVTPEFKASVNEFIASSLDLPREIKLDDEKMVGWNYREVVDEVRRIAEANSVTFVDVYPFYCGKETCRLWRDYEHRKTVFFDDCHLTPSSMRDFGKYLAAQPALHSVLFKQVVKSAAAQRSRTDRVP